MLSYLKRPTCFDILTNNDDDEDDDDNDDNDNALHI